MRGVGGGQGAGVQVGVVLHYRSVLKLGSKHYGSVLNVRSKHYRSVFVG